MYGECVVWIKVICRSSPWSDHVTNEVRMIEVSPQRVNDRVNGVIE